MANVYDFLQCDADDILRRPIKIKEWEVKPLTVRQTIEINPYVAKLSLDEFKDDLNDALNDLDENMKVKEPKADKLIKFIERYAETVNKIVTIVIGEDISSKATWEDYVYILAATVFRMGGTNFLKSTRLAKNLGLQGEAELIAADKYLTSLS